MQANSTALSCVHFKFIFFEGQSAMNAAYLLRGVSFLKDKLCSAVQTML